MRRSHRLALSAVALGVAAAVGGAEWQGGHVAQQVHAGDTHPGLAHGRNGRNGLGRSGVSVADGATTQRGGPPASSASMSAAAAHPAEAARREDLDAAVPRPIVLEDPHRSLGVAIVIAGRDPAGPRALDVWRVATDGRSVRIASGRSAVDGSLVLPPIVLPARPIEVLVAPRGSGPRDPAASRPIVVRRDPVAPRVVASRQGGELVLRIDAAENGGAILVERSDLSNARGVSTLARVDLEMDADAAPVPVEIAVGAMPDVAVQVVQVDPDGRRSPPRPVFVNDDDNDPTQE